MSRKVWIGIAIALTVALVGGGLLLARGLAGADRTRVTAYFDNTNGLYRGDEVRILGVPVGAIDTIEPQPKRAKVTFWVDKKYKIPADAKAVIVSPQLVTARAIQLTPAYTSGPTLSDGAVIPQDRTAVPMEWDDLRQQLEKLTNELQPTRPGGVSNLGAFVDTAADNLRGQGANIRNTIVQMSRAFSALGDHSNDTFTTIKNLSVVVDALHDSSSLLEQLNGNLAAVTGYLTDSPDAVGNAIKDLNSVVQDATKFLADNREAIGITSEKLSSIATTMNASIHDIKQALHVFPNVAVNFANVWQPTQSSLTGILAANNGANPLQFICGAIEAAARAGAQQSAKLCVQYLAPIFKNRQYNFMPLGENLFVGESARPNELTYSEDRLRPDFVPPQPAPGAAPGGAPAPAPAPGPAPSAGAGGPGADQPAGLSDMLLPAEGGSR